MVEARQTPRGARPNRRGEPARLDERVRTGGAPSWEAEAKREDEPSGRSLDPGREAGARGMIVAARCCKVGRRTESGLQAHPHLSALFSLYPSRFWLPLCLLCACYLKPFSRFHYAPRSLAQFADERRVMFLHGFHGVPEELCHIIRRGAARKQIDGKAVPETMGMRIENASSATQGEHFSI